MKQKNLFICLIALFTICLFCACSNSNESSSDQSSLPATPTPVPEYNIPKVVGLAKKDAESELKKLNIPYEIVEEKYDFHYKKGVIYEQSAFGSTQTEMVTLYCSRGLCYRTSKQEGKKLSSLKKELKPFHVSYHYTYSKKYGKDRIIESYLSNGVYYEGEDGSITVSNGKYSPKKVKGKNMYTAKKQFPGAKFKIKYKFNTAQRGTVLNYSVGTSDKKGKVPVTFTVSDGKAVIVPDVTGQSEVDATSKLIKKGIRYKIEYEYRDITSDPTEIANEVTFQNKSGKMNKNKTVKLTVNCSSITISSMGLRKDIADGVISTIEFNNETDKTISSIVFSVSFYDRVGDKYGGYDLKYVGPLYSWGYDENSWGPIYYDSAAAAQMPTAATVKFMDGSVQNITFEGRYWHTSEYAGGSSLSE